MKCIVTGGAGFIGSEIVKTLLKEGHEVIVLDNFSTGKRTNLPEEGVTIFNVDISKELPYMYTRRLTGCDAMFHLAALTKVEPSIHNPIENHHVNITGTLHMLQLCKTLDIKRFVLSSSCSVYGQANNFPTLETEMAKPLSPYALSKLTGEHYCKLFSLLYKIETVALRYANVYGSKQPLEGAYCNVLGIFANQRKQQLPLTIVGDGEQKRDYIHVSDVVNANLKAATNNSVGKGDVINVGFSKDYSVNEIAKMFGGQTSNLPPRIEPKKALTRRSYKSKKYIGLETKNKTPELGKRI
mgnify:CR=1 FL=1